MYFFLYKKVRNLLDGYLFKKKIRNKNLKIQN
jgi:hypothetical protein